MEPTVSLRKKYFVLNKESDFRRGYGDNIRIGHDGLSLRSPAAAGVYYTRIFDSRERRMAWHRLCLTGEMPGESSCTVAVYTSDSLFLSNEVTVEEVLSDKRLTMNQKEESLACFCRATYNIPKDILLFSSEDSVEGRYLWLKIELNTQAGQIPCISRVQIYFPKQTWLSYLPEVYSADRESASFLARYLGIFQTFFDDMTEQIEGTPGLLNPAAKGDGMLLKLADWLSIENKELWNEKQLVYLIGHARRIRACRGTVSCLKELVSLYTQTSVFIVEYHQICPFFDGRKRERLLKRLYARHRWEFALLTSPGKNDVGNSLAALAQIARTAKPAHMECRIVLLKPCILLDHHSYLGINSVLGRYRTLRLDGHSELPFSVIGAKNTRKADDRHEKSELFPI